MRINNKLSGKLVNQGAICEIRANDWRGRRATENCSIDSTVDIRQRMRLYGWIGSSHCDIQIDMVIFRSKEHYAGQKYGQSS